MVVTWSVRVGRRPCRPGLGSVAEALLNGFLVAVFTLHVGAFAGLYARRGRVWYLALCGTFGALTALYALKVAHTDPAIGGLSLQTGLRVLALSCTACYLGLRLRARRRALKEPPATR